MDKKFISSKVISDYEILTDDGFKNVVALHKTIEYQMYKLVTTNSELHCADNHIVFLYDDSEVFVKNLKIGQNIKTINGIEEVLHIEETDIYTNMYDFELSDNNVKYYTNGILSHNTTYIRHLITLLCNDKTIIYVPAYMVEQLANPEFISFIQRFKEAILILEDAEFCLQSRNDEYGAQAVSNLLNITNGLLNDVTKIQVIATFNMDKKNIDKALLRPGRLLKEWKFDKLTVEESINLAKSLNKDINITTSMTLAEIYSGKTQHRKSKKRIGIKDEE